jgi:hypothetical protein
VRRGPHRAAARARSPPSELSPGTGRLAFGRDHYSIALMHGDLGGAFERTGRRARKYLVGSDMGEDSRYAVEWGIGTVLRDGDEMLIVNVNKNEVQGAFARPCLVLRPC